MRASLDLLQLIAKMQIRPIKKGDIPQIAQLFHDTIRSMNNKDYSEEQVKAWAPDNIYFRDWEKECFKKFTFVTEKQKIITGFAELEKDGYIDCFYCHKDFQGQGVGKLLFQTLEDKARKLGLKKLTAEVSITAKPFFIKMGFSVQKEQTVSTRGVTFTNFKMQKVLKPAT